MTDVSVVSGLSSLDTPDLATRLDLVLAPDPRRVIIKLFVPGEDAIAGQSRASVLIERIAALDEAQCEQMLGQTRRRFSARHHDLDGTFQHHYELVRHRVSRVSDLSPTARLLVGAYFSHEYSVEAAALCNPSMVAHPDQGALAPGELRVALSVRQIGEGHLSSIGFASAILGPGNRLRVADRSGPLQAGRRGGIRHQRDLLAAGLAEEGWDNEALASVLGSLGELFDDEDLERAMVRLPAELFTRSTTQQTLEQLRRTTSASYRVDFDAAIPLHQRVLWPATPPESNGMEDARFVRYTDDAGQTSYQATYTAYDGRHIAGRLLSSVDLRRFEVTPLRGAGAGNKGMALFPRPVGGRQLALCRTDGETIGLSTLDTHSRWQRAVPLHLPRQGWDLIQVGNCGSPLETDAGWLVLTHGVGPMRRYAIGALMLDLDRPERVIAELPGMLLAPDETERDGYVPNVVYSCGALVHQGTLWVPYGISDQRVGFATVALADVLAAMSRTATR